MKQIAIAFLAAMSLAASGCKKTSGGDVAAKLTELKDKMCACKDQACAAKVTDELTRWSQDQLKAVADKEAKPSEEDTRKVVAISEAMNTCMQKIRAEATGMPSGVPGHPPTLGGSGGPGGAGGAAPSPAGSAAPSPAGSAAPAPAGTAAPAPAGSAAAAPGGW